MFSQRSVLPRLFISVVLAACLFCGTGIADEKSAQANSARSLNTSQDTLQEGDGRVSESGLIAEQKELITEIREIKAALENERENYRKTTGEEHLLAWTEVSKKLINLSDVLDLLIDNYSKQKEKGHETSEISMLI